MSLFLFFLDSSICFWIALFNNDFVQDAESAFANEQTEKLDNIIKICKFRVGFGGFYFQLFSINFSMVYLLNSQIWLYFADDFSGIPCVFDSDCTNWTSICSRSKGFSNYFIVVFIEFILIEFSPIVCVVWTPKGDVIFPQLMRWRINFLSVTLNTCGSRWRITSVGMCCRLEWISIQGIRVNFFMHWKLRHQRWTVYRRVMRWIFHIEPNTFGRVIMWFACG